MADITKPIVYSEEMRRLIADKAANPAFTYHNWSEDDLEDLRRCIRDHYRLVQLGLCAYCKASVSLQAALNCHVEHIAPKSKYTHFIFEPKNLCVICADCNAIKREQEVLQEVPDTLVNGSARLYPRSGGAFKLVHPHFDDYDDHIQIFGPYYVDKTKKGHFTIGVCGLNRRRLHLFGWEAEYDDADVAAAATEYLETKEPVARSRALRALKKKLVIT